MVTPPRLPGPASQRALLLPSVIAVHAALLIWVAASGVAPVAPAKAASLVIFNVAQDAPAMRPASNVEPVVLSLAVESPPPAPPLIESPPVPIDLPLPAAMSSASSACDLTDRVQTALRADADARAALLALPREARSVANAVMLWDGRWAALDGASSADAVTRVRHVVRAVVTGASEECRQTTQAGPRLITVAGPPDIVLALGSGRWRWNDLATGDQVASAETGQPGGSVTSFRAAADVAGR